MTRLWRTDPDRAAWIVLLATLPLVAALVLWLDRGTTYNVDQIRFFLATPDAGLRELFEPQNGNLLVTTTLAYKISLSAFGSSFVPFRLIQVVALLAAGTAFFALVKRWVGPAPALIAALILLVFGSDWGHVGTALGFTVLSSVAAGLAAMLLVERRDRIGDLGACALLTLSIASFSAGLAFLVGVAVSVVMGPDRWRRIWLVAIPFGLYLAWWLWARGGDSPSTGPELSNLLLTPVYAFVSLAAVLASLTGLNYDFSVDAIRVVPLGPGPALAVLALIGVIVRISRGRIPVLFWVALATVLAYWTLGALVVDPASGIRVPTKTRYMFPGAVMVLLVAAALIGRTRPSNSVAIGLLLIAAVGLATNLALLRDGAEYFRNEFSAPARAQFTMLDLARRSGRRGLRPALLGVRAQRDQHPRGPLPDRGRAVRVTGLHPRRALPAGGRGAHDGRPRARRRPGARARAAAGPEPPAGLPARLAIERLGVDRGSRGRRHAARPQRRRRPGDAGAVRRPALGAARRRGRRDLDPPLDPR